MKLSAFQFQDLFVIKKSLKNLNLKFIKNSLLGFLVATSIKTSFLGSYAITGNLVMQIFLSAVSWPHEAVHPSIKFFSILFSLVKPVESLRSILYKGGDIQNQKVMEGFLFLVIWIFFSIFLIGFVIKKK